MLTDAQWAELAPLVERCRPHAKVPPSNLRRTMSSAILWRHANGAKWTQPWDNTSLRQSNGAVVKRSLALIDRGGS